MLEEWIKEIKSGGNRESTGMILMHNGIVRATSKDGKKVKGMRLSFDERRLQSITEELKRKEGIAEIRVWINNGDLRVGDDIMYVLVAGRFRKDVLPVMEELLTRVKKEVVREEELLDEGYP